MRCSAIVVGRRRGPAPGPAAATRRNPAPDRAARARRDDVGKGEVEQRVVTLQQLTVRVSGLFIASIALLMVLATVGIEIAPALAGLGVVGIAVGFGAQKIFRDWLAGIFIVVENQYSVGDVVTIAGVSGPGRGHQPAPHAAARPGRHAAHRPERRTSPSPRT